MLGLSEQQQQRSAQTAGKHRPWANQVSPFALIYTFTWERGIDFFCTLVKIRPFNLFSASKAFSREVLKTHNDYRKNHGVPALKLSSKLCKEAQE